MSPLYRVCALFIALGLFFLSVPAHAQSPAPSTPPGGWQTVPHPITLRSAQEVVEQGQRAPDGTCTFAETLTLTPAETSVAQEEEAVNLATCQERVLRGTPPANDASLGTTRTGVPSQNSKPSTGVSPMYSGCTSCYESKGHAFTKFIDCYACGEHTVTSETT